ncbi:hypothetical protein L873DRAFT_1807556 [Choiromyces venosus 120613-1]|uniref:Uncharacterized protein n=1 Tax=Choiromyces venosus 120613-1 TaxID=1336337 RepID=A0A3N4JPW2_9PEZI|nr:hypothetical protein L873DRAFT_1807556 [Choiromyces venosus 120613-1]
MSTNPSRLPLLPRKKPHLFLLVYKTLSLPFTTATPRAHWALLIQFYDNHGRLHKTGKFIHAKGSATAGFKMEVKRSYSLSLSLKWKWGKRVVGVIELGEVDSHMVSDYLDDTLAGPVDEIEGLLEGFRFSGKDRGEGRGG